MDSPLPCGSVLPLSQAQPAQGGGTGVRTASLGPGEGLGLPGPRSGPQSEGQGWSWRTGELKEKCEVNWKDPGSVQLVCLSLGIFVPSYQCLSLHTFLSPQEFLHYLTFYFSSACNLWHSL